MTVESPMYLGPFAVGATDDLAGTPGHIWLDTSGSPNAMKIETDVGVYVTFGYADIATVLAAYELTANKNVNSGYAGLNSVSRTTKGVIATDDLIVDAATKGLVLKDTAGSPHYWRLSVSTLGVLTTTDLGTTAP